MDQWRQKMGTEVVAVPNRRGGASIVRTSTGFHCFRRFRESVLLDYWMGHENRDMGTRYAKQLIENIEWRKEWAEKVGLGFKLPSLPLRIGQLGQLSEAKIQSAKAS